MVKIPRFEPSLVAEQVTNRRNRSRFQTYELFSSFMRTCSHRSWERVLIVHENMFSSFMRTCSHRSWKDVLIAHDYLIYSMSAFGVLSLTMTSCTFPLAKSNITGKSISSISPNFASWCISICWIWIYGRFLATATLSEFLHFVCRAVRY